MFQTLLQLALQNKFEEDRNRQKHQWDLEKLASQQQQQERGWENILNRQQQMEQLKQERDRIESEQAGSEFGPSLNAAITSAYGPESAIPEPELQKLGKFASRLSPKDQQQLHNNLLDSHKAAYTAQNSIRSPQIHTVYDEASGRNKLIGTAYDLKTKKFITQDINYYDKESDMERDKKLLVTYLNNPENLDEKQTTRAKLLYGKYINDVTKMVTTQNVDAAGSATTDVTAVRAPEEPGGQWDKQVVAQGRREPALWEPGPKGKLQGDIAADEHLLQQFRMIKDAYKDKFLSYESGFDAFTKHLRGKIDPKYRDQDLAEYSKFHGLVSQAFNQYRHIITGAQAAMQEIDFLQKSFISGKLSPQEFQAKLQGLEMATKTRIKTNQELLKVGPQGAGGLKINNEQPQQNPNDPWNLFGSQ